MIIDSHCHLTQTMSSSLMRQSKELATMDKYLLTISTEDKNFRNTYCHKSIHLFIYGAHLMKQKHLEIKSNHIINQKSKKL